MPKRFEQYRLHCRVLAPLHIGTGEEIDPTEIVCDPTPQADTKTALFHRIRPEQVILEMTPDARRQWEAALAKGDFRTARLVLQKSTRLPKNNDPGHARYSLVGLGKFAQLFSGTTPGNEGLYEILGMMRNADGSISIPGSSIKGALRTAIIDERVRKAGGLTLPDGTPFRTDGRERARGWRRSH